MKTWAQICKHFTSIFTSAVWKHKKKQLHFVKIKQFFFFSIRAWRVQIGQDASQYGQGAAPSEIGLAGTLVIFVTVQGGLCPPSCRGGCAPPSRALGGSSDPLDPLQTWYKLCITAASPLPSVCARVCSHEAGSGDVPVRAGRGGDRDAAEREVLHPAARGDRELLLHVALHQGPEVPRLGLGGRPGERSRPRTSPPTHSHKPPSRLTQAPLMPHTSPPALCCPSYIDYLVEIRSYNS